MAAALTLRVWRRNREFPGKHLMNCEKSFKYKLQIIRTSAEKRIQKDGLISYSKNSETVS